MIPLGWLREGLTAVSKLNNFDVAMNRHFQSGKLCGARIYASEPEAEA